jgi:hypothetical protein
MLLRNASGAVSASLLAVLAVPLAAWGQTCPDPVTLTRGLSGPLTHVRYLADDALEGREVGSDGAHCAGRYVAEQFRALGLEPGVPGGSYFQPFEVRKGAELGSRNRLAISTKAYVLGKDWTPFGFSASTAAEVPLVYAGYGVTGPGGEGAEPAHPEVSGKAMVVEWGAPSGDPHGQGLQAEPHFKATVAAGRNAAALLVLLPEGTSLPSLDEEIRNALAIPVVAVAGAAAAAVRAATEEGAPASLETDVRPTTADARNVVAVLPGSDPGLRDEFVVVGAHFDHLGMGGDGSLDPDAREVHNGADDNASGTAALLDIAARLTQGPPPARTVVFVGFTGEEKGLWGSGHYVANPTVDLERAVAMINLDMVGRLRDGGVSVFGTGTAQEWEDILNGVNDGMDRPLTLGFSPDGYGPSDHASFYGAGVPVLHFFTNTHADYHRPGDDWDKIDGEGIQSIAELSARIARRLAGTSTTEALSLTPVQQERQAPATSSESSSRSGYGPYFGTIPDMTPRDFGLRITGVREGSPAELAGLKSGDVIVEFDGKEIADIYAYTYALREKAPGDEVVVVVERDGERVRLTAVLAARR